MKIFFKILLIIFLLLLSLNFYRVIVGNHTVSFSSFITFLSETDTFDIPTLIRDLEIVADWGVFNFLRDFFNTFIAIIQALLYICTLIGHIVIVFIRFVRYIFVM